MSNGTDEGKPKGTLPPQTFVLVIMWEANPLMWEFKWGRKTPSIQISFLLKASSAKWSEMVKGSIVNFVLSEIKFLILGS